MGKSERSFIHLVSLSACLLHTIVSVEPQTGWFHLLTLVVGLRITGSSSAHACNYLRFAHHPMLGLSGLRQQVQASPGRSEEEPACSRSPMGCLRMP